MKKTESGGLDYMVNQYHLSLFRLLYIQRLLSLEIQAGVDWLHWNVMGGWDTIRMLSEAIQFIQGTIPGKLTISKQLDK